MPPIASPREERIAFHRRHVAYHRTAAADHALRGEVDAETRHRAAVQAHELLTDGRTDFQQEGLALRLSAMADHATYQARKGRSE